MSCKVKLMVNYTCARDNRTVGGPEHQSEFVGARERDSSAPRQAPTHSVSGVEVDVLVAELAWYENVYISC